MIRSKYVSIYVFLLALFVSGCSTTSHLPEGEQLYTGIEDITYDTDLNIVRRSGTKKAQNDSSGVITAFSDAAKAIDQALSGQSVEPLNNLSKKEQKELLKKQKAEEEEQQMLDKVSFNAAREEVDAVLAYAPNYALFGSSSLRSPFQPGLWIYNAFNDSRGGLGKWLFKHFASDPVFISNVAPDTRVKVAQNTLHNHGFFHGKVTYEVLTQKNPKKARIAYHVNTGNMFRLDSISYLGFAANTDSLIHASESDRYLHRGDAFNVLNLTDERTRISKLFRENGYYYYSPEFITYRADTFIRKDYVQLQVKQAEGLTPQQTKRWYIGNVYVNVSDEKGIHDFTMPRMRRSRGSKSKTTSPTVKLSAERLAQIKQKTKELPVRPYLFSNAVFHRYGDLYRLRFEDLTIEKLNSLGVFSQLEMSYLPVDTLPTCDTLNIFINAVMDKLYDTSLEMNATVKSNQQVGPGLTYSLSKRNAFKAGEKVSFKLFGSYEWQTGTGSEGGNSLLNSYELGTSLSFEFPRFVLPFVSRRQLRFPATTTFALEADWRNRAGFFQIISTAISANYAWHKRRTANHEVMVKLNYDRLIHKTVDFDSIMNANPVIQTSMRNNYIPSLSYTFTYQTDSRHSNPLWLQWTIKEAGNLTSLVYRLRGKPFDQIDKTFFGTPFSQFLKTTAELHWAMPFDNRRFSLAARAYCGAIFSYGNSTGAPYSEQFYVGGANSLRGFTVRSVGPGAYRSPEAKYSYIDQTGDFKLEMNAELRANLFGNLNGAVFVDAGNIWLLRHHDGYDNATLSASNLSKIAVNTGLGLRYDLDFLILRFDLGVPLHAPYDTGKSGWYNIPKFWKGLAFHFAIGYPF